MKTLHVERLTRAAFAPFGDVIELDGARHFPINGGTTERYHDLANVDVTENGGRPLINLFRAQPRALPIEITMMERHPLGSQAFIPLTARRYLVVVAPAGELDPARTRAFWSDGWQGVNYAKGVWHHPLLALDQVSDFVVVDRGGEQPNCDELSLTEPWRLLFEASVELAEQGGFGERRVGGRGRSRRAPSCRDRPESQRGGDAAHAAHAKRR